MSEVEWYTTPLGTEIYFFCPPGCEDCDKEREYYRWYAEYLSNQRLVSFAAARNVRRRLRRHDPDRYLTLVSVYNKQRDRMNPLRTTWGRSR